MAKKIIKYWTEEDSYYVYKNFNQRSVREISVTLGRSYESIRSHYYATASKKDWTEYEDLLGNGKVCPSCNTRYLLNSLNWHRNKANANGYDSYCKICRNKIKREKTRERAKLAEKKQLLAEKKQLDEITRRMLLEERERIKDLGLDISKLRLNVGQVYKVKMTDRNRITNFEGKLIQDTINHVTLQNRKGIRESFLKVDLLIKEEYEVVV